METLFVYGTLRFARIQREAIGRTVKGAPTVLPDYKRSRVIIERDPYPIIIRCKGCSVRGLVLSVSKKELGLLDKYESEIYERAKVKLKDGRTAWVYRKPF